MITLTAGNVQDASDNPLKNGSLVLYINTNAVVIGSPFGIVEPLVPAVFQFDKTGNLEPNAMIWANSELLPQVQLAPPVASQAGPLNPSSGTSEGSGTAWTNPSNITAGNPSSYATVTLAAS